MSATTAREPLDTARFVTDRLIRWEPSEHPVVSVYADWRVGGRGLHESPTIVRRRLREEARALIPRGLAERSFSADTERIQRYLAGEADAGARGIVIFACHGQQYWRTLTLSVPIETSVHVGERPALLPLVETVEDAPRTLVAVLDTNTVRLLRLDPAGVSEVRGPHRPAWEGTRYSAAGGWSLGHHQHAKETELRRWAAKAAAGIKAEMDGGGFARLVIACEDVIASRLLDALATAGRRVEHIEHLDIRAPLDAVAERVWPQVSESARAARALEVEAILDRAEAVQDATTHPPAVMAAAEAGRIDTLALAPEATEPAVAELLLREALAHRSRVVVARGHKSLIEAGGVAATLR